MSRRAALIAGGQGEYNPDSAGYVVDPEGWGVGAMSEFGHKWKRLLYAPWYNAHGMGKNPSIWITIAHFLLMFIGAMFFAWTFVAAYSAALTAGTDPFLTSIVLGLISAAWVYLIANWTRDNDIKLFPDSGIAFGSIFNFKHVGILAFLLWSVAIMGGGAAAGGILKALGITGPSPLVNVATSSTSYWLGWVGASIIIFVWIFNDNLEQTNEDEVHNHRRFTLLAAVATFVFTVAFYGQGIISYFPHVYLAGAIASSEFFATFGGDSVTPWAFWIFVPMLASGATAGLLYILFDALGYGNSKLDEADPRSNDEKETYQPEGTTANSRVGAQYHNSARLRNRRKLDVRME